jgi:hypothetical protein
LAPDEAKPWHAAQFPACLTVQDLNVGDEVVSRVIPFHPFWPAFTVPATAQCHRSAGPIRQIRLGKFLHCNALCGWQSKLTEVKARPAELCLLSSSMILQRIVNPFGRKHLLS